MLIGRSLMNVPFTIPKGAELEKEFLSEATKEGLVRADTARFCVGPLSDCCCGVVVSGDA